MEIANGFAGEIEKHVAGLTGASRLDTAESTFRLESLYPFFFPSNFARSSFFLAVRGWPFCDSHHIREAVTVSTLSSKQFLTK